MRKCLLAVQGPLQFLAGLIAMEWYWQVNHKSADAETALLLYDFLCPPDQEQLLVDTIMRLTEVRKWDKTLFISGQEMRKISRQNCSQSVKDLRKMIGLDGFDEIYIARDYCGFGSSLILNSYKQAARITYGDSFGLVGNEAEFELRWWDLRSALPNAKTLLRGLLYGKPVRLGFDAAVLSLPIDWSGSYLEDIPLLVPRREHVLNIIERVCSRLPDLTNYCDSLLEGESNSYLFLLSNLSASGTMSRENEVTLYIDVVRQIAPKGSSIILKDHPRSGPYVLNSVISSIKADYRIKVIDDVHLSRIPVELWTPLISSCSVVPIYSTSAININYFYDKDVILPLDDARIKKYFFHDKIAAITKGHRAIFESVNNLKKWDGNSPLWKGC